MSTAKAPASIADPMLPFLYRVKGVKRETRDTFTLNLEPGNGGGLGAFRPGQFNMVYVYGVGEVPISISGDASRTGVMTHTTRAVGTVTRVMEKLRAGSAVGLRGPFGTSWPVDRAKGQDVVLVAGGIGLAPLRPVLYHILANREQYGRIVLLYGTRSPSDILFKTELQKWGGSFSMDVFVTVDRADRQWHGNIGVVTHLIKRAPFDPLNVVAMVCGPEVMMRFTAQELVRRGVNPADVHVSMERNMKCAIGLCGHCQFGPRFVCKDGPVFTYDYLDPIISKREL
ncbi:FAD/NAD(P)-binding protein [Candidatus Poribacteria bacterium]|nr:FAD/NAD(P)-binding protein [Candidatus Poribacteria bacterium]